ncbi:hypothetical protein D9M71_776760 [compost metagenome]
MPGLPLLGRDSITSTSTWMVSPAKVGPLMSSSMFRKATPTPCSAVWNSRPSAMQNTCPPGTRRPSKPASRRNSLLVKSTSNMPVAEMKLTMSVSVMVRP